MKAKTSVTIIIMLLILTNIAVAQETTTTKTNLAEVEYKQIVIQENAKTQAYIKQELAKRDAEIEKKINKYVDDNFAFLDNRIDGFIRKASFKLGMVFLSGMVLGGSILLLINNKLRRKKLVKKNLLPEEAKERTYHTTTNEETLEQAKKLQRGEEPDDMIKERIKDLKKDLIDELTTKKAGINDYLRLGDAQ